MANVFDLPAVVVAGLLTGVLGILGAVLAAKIGKRKSGPELTQNVSVNVVGSTHRTGVKKLRQVSATLVFVAVLIVGLFVYGQVTGQAGDTLQISASNRPPGEPTETLLVPVAAEGEAVRDSVVLSCTGQRVTYTADNLIDPASDTAWWASTGDEGIGRFAVVTFASTVHLTKVGLIPGYAGLKQRGKQDCKLLDSFPFNRHITSVRYDFEDGTAVTQYFTWESKMQTQPVDSITKSVRITILGTALPAGADDDTLISGTYFAGSFVR